MYFRRALCTKLGKSAWVVGECFETNVTWLWSENYTHTSALSSICAQMSVHGQNSHPPTGGTHGSRPASAPCVAPTGAVHSEPSLWGCLALWPGAGTMGIPHATSGSQWESCLCVTPRYEPWPTWGKLRVFKKAFPSFSSPICLPSLSFQESHL